MVGDSRSFVGGGRRAAWKEQGGVEVDAFVSESLSVVNCVYGIKTIHQQ